MAERATGKETKMSTGTDSKARRHPRTAVWATAMAAIAIACAMLGLAVSPAAAKEGIIRASVTTSDTQAGGHPDIKFLYEWNTRVEPPLAECHCDDARMIVTDTPTGLVGNPHAIPTCTLDAYSLGECAEEAQVGYFAVKESTLLAAPAYNMVTHPDQAGLIAWTVPLLGVPVFMDISSRTDSDYGLESTAGPIYHILPFVNQIELTLWGVPESPVHAPQRFKTPLQTACLFCAEFGAVSNWPEIPYLQNPTTCGEEELKTKVTIEYYTRNKFSEELPYPPTTGCDSLSFNPSLTAQPTTSQADTPSGLDVNLKVPQVQSASTPSPSEIRSSIVHLPMGFTINASAADGKVACSDYDSAIGRSRGPANCPENSKIGSVTIDSSALPGPINGAMFLGQPLPGNRYRVFLTGDGFGTHVKLAGSIHPDPTNGQLTISFIDLPQSPLSEFDMHIFGSERGALATPDHCGSFPVESEFIPWDARLAPQTSKSFFSITSGPEGRPCPGAARPFNPSFQAGTANATAGMHTPFNLRISRADGDQNLSGLTVKAAPGFAATLKGVPYCPQSALDKLATPGYSGIAEQESAACPEASQIGTASAGAGAGTHPVYVKGKVYLAGPYKGAPLSMVTVLPAVSGPYDLGVVALRTAIFVDPETAQISAVADPFPSIIEGIPLRARMLEVNLDRHNFTFNPTNCDPFAVDATILGDQGASAARSNHFQVADCTDLAYEPSLSIELRGGLNRRGHPAVHAVLTTGKNEANSLGTSVTLPKGELLDNGHIGTVCTAVAFKQENCPAGSVYGEAEAFSPALDQPLKGLVYLRSSKHRLPDLAIKLKGQIEIELDGRVDSVNGRMRVRFQSLPDVPVSRFVLDMKGGARGLLQNSESVCGKTKRATVRMVGQNGIRSVSNPKLLTACGSAKRHKRHVRRPARTVR